MPLLTGSIKPSAAFAAIAASTALPPDFRISIPICVANGTLVQTIPCLAITSERVAKALPVTRSICASELAQEKRSEKKAKRRSRFISHAITCCHSERKRATSQTTFEILRSETLARSLGV